MLSNLEFLDLSDCAIGDEGLRHLRGLSKLEYLYIRNGRITDIGLKHLEGHENLRGFLPQRPKRIH